MNTKRFKKLNDFTLKEYEEFESLIDNIEENIEELFLLFDIDKKLNEMTIDEFQNVVRYIKNQKVNNDKKGVKKYYNIGNIKYKPTLNITKVTAGQFIDLQTALAEKRPSEILACILIPTKKIFGFIIKKYEYGNNKQYSTIEVEQHLYNNFKIGDYAELSDFFLRSSTNVLRVTKDYLAKKQMLKMKNKKIKF